MKLTDREALLSKLLFEAGERVHHAHMPPGEAFTTIVTCTTSSLCQRIMAALVSAMDPPVDGLLPGVCALCGAPVDRETADAHFQQQHPGEPRWTQAE